MGAKEIFFIKVFVFNIYRFFFPLLLVSINYSSELFNVRPAHKVHTKMKTKTKYRSFLFFSLNATNPPKKLLSCLVSRTDWIMKPMSSIIYLILAKYMNEHRSAGIRKESATVIDRVSEFLHQCWTYIVDIKSGKISIYCICIWQYAKFTIPINKKGNYICEIWLPGLNFFC